MIQITEKSPITTHISDESVIKNFLTYKYEWWKQGLYRKEKQTATYPLVKKGYFLSGFQQRVFDYLDKRKIEYAFTKPEYGVEVKEPELKGIEFRPDQQTALKDMINAKRGVWQAPTGSGKTILICGLVSAFVTTALMVVHTTTLFKQTIEELEKFFGKGEIGRLGCGEFEQKDISVGMIQTLDRYYKGKPNDNQWGMVIVDEAHHANNLTGSYGKVLKKIFAPIRFGFTATLPQTEKGKMSLEGLIGPVIGETEYEKLQEEEVLAKPIVKMYKVPITDRYEKLRGGYKAIYEKGIVNNRARNLLIIEKAKELIEQGLTVLIMVERISHGDILYDMAEFVMPGAFCFLHGNTDEEIKEQEKWAFEEQDRRGVIATRIWSEGVNIKSIGSVMNAVGDESSIAVIQKFGRGMRKTEGKETVIFVDMIDLNHEWFRKHSLKRMITYLEAGWKIEQ